MEEQVDELGDLDVVNGDVWLAFASDDQVLLSCSFAKVHAPRRYAEDSAPRQIRIRQIGFNQNRSGQVRLAEVGTD